MWSWLCETPKIEAIARTLDWPHCLPSVQSVRNVRSRICGSGFGAFWCSFKHGRSHTLPVQESEGRAQIGCEWNNTTNLWRSKSWSDYGIDEAQKSWNGMPCKLVIWNKDGVWAIKSYADVNKSIWKKWLGCKNWEESAICEGQGIQERWCTHKW